MVDDIFVELGGVDEEGDVLPILRHDKLDGVLVLLQRGPKLLVFMLKLSDVSVLLLNAWNKSIVHLNIRHTSKHKIEFRQNETHRKTLEFHKYAGSWLAEY